MASTIAFINKSLIITIYCYQCYISPFLKTRCRFYPSCSQYSIDVLQRFGLIKGGWLAIIRLLQCHPLNTGNKSNHANSKKVYKN